MPEKKLHRVFYVTARGQSAKSFLVRHLQLLSQSGFEPYLACSDDKAAKEVARLAGIPHLAIPLKAEISLLSDLKALLGLILHIKRQQPSVVHGHMSKAGLTSMLSSWFCRVPVRIYHNHGMACFSASGVSKNLLMIVEKVTCMFATDVVFCSDSTREKAIELGICSVEKSTVLGGGTISGVDTEKFSPENSKNASEKLLSELGLTSSSKKYIGFVGRIVPHKGVDTLLSAWSLLPADFRSHWTLLLAGSHASGPLYSRLESFEKEHSSVQYLDRIDNIVGLYGLLDLLVLPSWHEGFPYSVLEAQACGVPAIVTDVTGNQDAVIDGITGSLVDVKSPEKLASAIQELLSDEAAYKCVREKARDRIVNEFSEDTVLNNLLNFYRKKLAA